jgi:phospholipase/lecithinase/hemolysin
MAKQLTSLNWRYYLSAGLMAGLIGCGGGSDLGPKVDINRVFVAGDSLADVGTFSGLKFTVQNAADPAAGYPIWPQLVANAYGLDGSAQCNHYAWEPASGADDPTFALNDNDCTNYAIGGGRVNAGARSAELNVTQQLSDMADAATFTNRDLLLVVGGGNDLADLATLYLGINPDDPATITAYTAFLAQELDVAVIGQLMAQGATGPAQAAGAYMTALAETFYEAIETSALDNGAKQVVIVNMPDVTLTPRFLGVLQFVEANTDAATATQVKGAIQAWATAFNNQLKTLASGESRVAVVDFYADFTDQINNPGDYGLTNVVDAACPGEISACADALLDLDTSDGKAPGWWKDYAFSDGFHPTPKGHQGLAASVSRALARAGWL